MRARRSSTDTWRAPGPRSGGGRRLRAPRRTCREPVLAERLHPHLDSVAGFHGRHVAPALDRDRIDEVLVEMIDVLEHAVLQRSGHRDVVDERDVLHVLAQPDASGMRADRYAELRGHQQHGEDLVYAAEAARVDLAEADGLRLEKLLEDHAVLAVLAGGHADRRDGLRDGGVAEHVVGARGLFHPVGIEPGPALGVPDGLPDVPDLVRGPPEPAPAAPGL